MRRRGRRRTGTARDGTASCSDSSFRRFLRQRRPSSPDRGPPKVQGGCLGLSRVLPAVQLVALDLRDEAFSADAKLLCELRLVPPGLPQTLGQDPPLDLLEDLVQ